MKTTPALVTGLLVIAAIMVWLARNPEGVSAPGRTGVQEGAPPAKRERGQMPVPGKTGDAARNVPLPPARKASDSPVAANLEIPSGLLDLVGDLDEAGIDAEDRAERILEIARKWSAVDPAGALAWAFTLEPGSDRAVAALILREAAVRDPAGTLATLEGLKSGNPRLHRDAVRLLFNHWAGGDPAAAWEAAGSVADPGERAAIEGDILLHWGESEPSVVAGILDSLVATPAGLEDLTAVFEATAGALAAGDPNAAATWAASLPAGPARSSAMSGLMGNWLQQDFQSATAWLGRLEPGEARDAGISKLVLATRNREPQAAMQWSALVADPALRSRLTMAASLSWWSADPEAARRAVDQSGSLTPEEKTEIREAFEQLGQ